MRINLDFELLRTLIAFADTGSFKRAAQIVFLSQPAVSMQMRRLEELVGHELFSKRGRDVTFTEKGLQVVAQARKIVAAHDRLVSQLHGTQVEGRVAPDLPRNSGRRCAPVSRPGISGAWDVSTPLENASRPLPR